MIDGVLEIMGVAEAVARVGAVVSGGVLETTDVTEVGRVTVAAAKNKELVSVSTVPQAIKATPNIATLKPMLLAIPLLFLNWLKLASIILRSYFSLSC